MSYKALIFDLDGTAIPNKPEGMPSPHLVETIFRAKNFIHLCAATGRSISNAWPILEKLGLISPCIISGGTQIIDPQTKKILWEKEIPEEKVKEIITLFFPYPYEILFSDELSGVKAEEKTVWKPERIIYVMNVDKKDIDFIMGRMEGIKEVVVHPVQAWTPGCFDIHITHKEATKRHSLEILLIMLKVTKAEVVGVGDSDNDIPLFEAVGYKVAMGNSTEKLKAMADYIAPSVEEGGLIQVIEGSFHINNRE